MSDSYENIYSAEKFSQLRRDKQMADAAGVSPAQIRLLRTQGKLLAFLSQVAEREIELKAMDNRLDEGRY